MRGSFLIVAAAVLTGASLPQARGFIYKTGDDRVPTALNEGLRWDAAPRIIRGQDRSLVGGLSWNVQGGTFAAFKANFTWTPAVPSDAQIQSVIEQAFGYWTSIDTNPLLPVAAPFTFVRDAAVVSTVNPATGAEIDLLAGDQGFVGHAGGTLTHPLLHEQVTLTSGTGGYPSDVIGGIDIYMNNHPGTTWSLRAFELLLAHEIGHALGMGHPESGLAGRFVDDNYDGTSEASANATLTNHFSHLINPLDPSSSPGLNLYTVPNTLLGTNASDVRILMERFINPVPGGVNPVSPDDYAQRQFLYPVQVPEPGSSVLLSAACLALCARRRNAPSGYV
jgi:hypothetical protein